MEPGSALDAVMGDALEVLRIVSILATPAMPETCAQIWSRIGLSGTPAEAGIVGATWGGYPGGVPVVKGDGLFPRIAKPAAD
jgi:methionyl-tRNA synthetase